MHEVLVNRLGGPSLPRKSVVRLTDRPYMTLDVYRGRKNTTNNTGVNKFCDFLFGSLAEYAFPKISELLKVREQIIVKSQNLEH